ncbi:uncharacterized protein LOC126884970 [Diabrotica virgifera virgifera]|uniref:Uncharacterized protein LOC114348856 n=1 Tax=Diabrotica virgifera virgifera TaxID=50390 RepID=A0A6P7GZG1_DIAVI|nr:uncharacterized protein LOC126884970 [Diabrotica virgifera virgifera]
MKFIFLLFLVAAVFSGLQKNSLANRLPRDSLTSYESGNFTSEDCIAPPEFCNHEENFESYRCWRWGEVDRILMGCITDDCDVNCRRTKNNFKNFKDCMTKALPVCSIFH